MIRKEITAIAVAIGPGTFNGVRVAVSTAKLLARGLGVPLIGVDTLEVHAAVAPRIVVRPILDASRGEVATALFRDGCRLEPDHLANADDLFEDVPDEPTLIVGELKPEWRTAIARLGPTAILGTSSQCRRRPAALAELAATRLANGDTDDPATLLPIYLRQPHITQPKARA